MSINLATFKESRFSALSHDVRVWIWGQDVSRWIKGTLTISYGNRDSFNVCTFELSNPHRIFQVTRTNWGLDEPGAVQFQSNRALIQERAKGAKIVDVKTVDETEELDPGNFNRAGGEYSEVIKEKIFGWKNDPWVSPTMDLNVTVSEYGSVEGSQPKPNSAPPGAPEKHTLGDTQERRYRLAIGDCIFSKHDPIRVFVRDPYTQAGGWMEVFCGYVSDHPISTNYITGESTIRINAYCIRQMMTKMRCAINSRTTNLVPEPVFTSGFYKDFANPGTQTHAFAGKVFEDAVKELILGTVVPRPLEVGVKGNTVLLSASGIGNFKLGNIVCYDPQSPKDEQLARWHLMTLFGVHKTPFPKDPTVNNLWLTEKEMKQLGTTTLPFDQGPDARYLHMLLPLGGTGAASLIEQQVDAQTPAFVQWSTRWEILRDLASRLDFQILTSPSGDILVEFPQYNFTPRHYFPLQGVFTVDIHQKDDVVSDESEDFATILVVTGGVAQTGLQTQESTQTATNLRAFMYSPVLNSRYGSLLETHDIPYLMQNPGEQASKDAHARIKLLGLMEYTKRLAAASSLETSIVYRPFLFPNRPLWMKRSSRIGLMTNVTHTWTVGREATTSVTLHMLMAPRPGDVDKDGNEKYRLPTGAFQSPIAYDLLWGTSAGYPLSGVFADVAESNAQGTQPEAEDPPQPSNVPATASDPGQVKYKYALKSAPLSTLYPPFRDLVEASISEWNTLYPNDPIFITSTFRSTTDQANLRSEGRPAGTVAKGWSHHSFGLAADIQPASCGKTMENYILKRKPLPYKYLVTYKKLAEICMRNGLQWQGQGDPVHFYAPQAWCPKVDACVSILKNAHSNDINTLWRKLDVTYNFATGGPVPVPAPLTPEEKAAGLSISTKTTALKSAVSVKPQAEIGAGEVGQKCDPHELGETDLVSATKTAEGS